MQRSDSKQALEWLAHLPSCEPCFMIKDDDRGFQKIVHKRMEFDAKEWFRSSIGMTCIPSWEPRFMIRTTILDSRKRMEFWCEKVIEIMHWSASKTESISSLFVKFQEVNEGHGQMFLEEWLLLVLKLAVVSKIVISDQVQTKEFRLEVMWSRIKILVEIFQ